jgi:hypothetical protein
MFLRALTIGGLTILMASGCAEMFGRQGMPADPLFASGKPAESKATNGPATPMPYSEPTPPTNKTRPDPALIVSTPPRER